MPSIAVRTFSSLALLAACSAAGAHEGLHAGAGFAAGAAHPLSGLDHMLAMIAVGLWAAMLGRRATWLLPVLFPAAMVLGGALAWSGVPWPGVGVGVAASVVVLGALIAFEVRAPLALASVIVAALAVFHGHAHGAEMPASVSVAAYATGFVAATVLLHAAGAGFALGVRRFAGTLPVRAVGATIAAAGVAGWFGVA